MAAPATPVHVALGANLGDRARTLVSAVDALAALCAPGTSPALSGLYETAPLGPADQPDYLNAVARLSTALGPEPLLDALQAVERRHGRAREGARRWGARTLDLDLLLHGDARLDTARLVLPHPGLAARAFVLAPLADLDPELVVPGEGRTVGELLARVGRAGVRRVDGAPEPFAR